MGREDPRKEEENRSRPEEAETEDYVISFMDKSLVLDWNKLNSKVTLMWSSQEILFWTCGEVFRLGYDTP